jgi:hypothetical protein
MREMKPATVDMATTAVIMGRSVREAWMPSERSVAQRPRP